MKPQIQELIKNMIDENAVDFKNNTAKVLYTKINKKLEEQYKETAKKVFSIQEKKVKIEDLDRVEGHEHKADGIGARYVGTGTDGKKYSFWHKGDANTPHSGLMTLPHIEIDDPRIESLEVLDQ
jgi:phage terminase small subunit